VVSLAPVALAGPYNRPAAGLQRSRAVSGTDSLLSPGRQGPLSEVTTHRAEGPLHVVARVDSRLGPLPATTAGAAALDARSLTYTNRSSLHVGITAAGAAEVIAPLAAAMVAVIALRAATVAGTAEVMVQVIAAVAAVAATTAGVAAADPMAAAGVEDTRRVEGEGDTAAAGTKVN
jgi:hypothetical protein